MFTNHYLEAIELIIAHIRSNCAIFQERVYFAYSLGSIYDNVFGEPNPLDCYVVYAGDTIEGGSFADRFIADETPSGSTIMSQQLYVTIGIHNREDVKTGIGILRLAGQAMQQVHDACAGYSPIPEFGTKLVPVTAPPTFHRDGGLGYFNIGYEYTISVTV